ncbi:hypothetical protein DL96DRAFT_1709936 [Flagelloscypha sp. PMI_526]|nr:hypothetical protein DL96DRAFT_1709936 [Flagelloscypha sp. PMI_526]
MLCSILFSALAVLSVVQAACTSPRQRKDWTTLTDSEKSSYISAVRCLHGVSSVSGIVGAVSKYDDFVGTHIDQVSIIHFVGQFLPWHRYMMWAYENALRTDCGYSGAQPYWNEIADAGAFTSSALLQANDLSFGGDGDASNNNCVSTGPFANLTLHVGPGTQVTNHCLSRAVSDRGSDAAAQSYVDTCLAYTDFSSAWQCIESTPHAAGHAGVGSEMVNVASSPNDPLFFMHHTFIDKLWYDWQQVSPSTRTNAIAGCTTQGMGACAVATTLDYTMSMADITPDVTVGDVMDTQGDYLCYEYV